MPIVPKNPADQIQFYTVHVPVWSEDPGAVGLSPEITSDLHAQLETARAAYERTLETRLAAEAATLVYRAAVRQLHGTGSAAIATIKAFAEVTDDVTVYVKAQIPPPSTSRAPRPAPGAPKVSSASVDSVGTLTLEWAAAPGDSVGPSSGIYYEVHRRRAGLNEAQAVLVGTTAGLMLRDPEIGPGQNVYMVRARRGVHTGPMSVAVTVTLPGVPALRTGHAADAPDPSTAHDPRPLRRAA